MTSNKEFVPVQTACRLLGVSKQRVHQLMSVGELHRMDMDGTVLVGMDSINWRISMRIGERRKKNVSRKRMGSAARC
jgi:hypothetical protein